MKQLQRLFAAFVLVCALSFNAAADGIIQTGTPPPPPPPPSTQRSMTDEEPAPVETAEDEATVLDAAAAFALDLLRGTLTLF